MALSKELVSQFVKATKDDSPKKSESVVYGVIDAGGNVKIDGSDTAIPISDNQTTTVLGEGNRVTVMIKDHRAVVTGNLSDNAVTIKKVREEVDTLNSEYVKTKYLEANYATITSLDAEKLRVDDLLGKKATVEDLLVERGRINILESSYAKLGDVYATRIDVDTLLANKADVTDLEADQARIGVLESDVANIDTLIFGSASGSTIQTSFANAVIAQLGAAQIKSAMIESVSASKITSGDIITNKVRIISEDGKMILSDETIQIRDEDENVRVQLGKDGDSNYSIAIYDENGDVIFTEGGFQQPIIRNDMVSDTANIHASKLDIDSLFEEINDDGSNVIKSAKVKLDDKNLTLDVAFSQLEGTVSSQGSAISANTEAISARIWQQDINAAKNELSTQYSTLEQDVGSFKTTVSEIYATKTSLTDVYNRTIHKSGTIDLTGDEYDVDTYYPVVGNIMPYDGYRYVGVNVQLNSGSKPSWSTHDGGFTCNVSVRMKADGWGGVDANTLGWIDDFTYNFCDKMPAYIHQNRNASKPVLYLRGGGRYFVFTDYDASWTIYTEDYIQSSITFSPTTNPSNSPNLVDNWKTISRVSTAESNITQLSNKITLNVTETTNLGTRMTAVEQTADSLTIKLTNIEIGGENILRDSKTIGDLKYGNSTIVSLDNGFNASKCLGDWSGVYILANNIISNSSVGDEFTFAVNMKSSSAVLIHFYAMCYDSNNQRVYPSLSPGQINNKNIGTASDGDEDKRYAITFQITQGWLDLIAAGGRVNWTIQVSNVTATSSPAYLYAPKLERGNKTTDWSPNSNDIFNGIDGASKTATNYLNLSSGGLVIGDLTSSTLGKNILLDSDSVDIRSGTDVRASFGEDYLYLAKHSRNATIDLCNGLAKLYHASSTSYDTIFVIDTPNITKIRGTYNPLQIESTVSGKTAIQFANTSGVLGSIGMVASGTEAYITRNCPSTTATYSILDTGNFYKLMDSGWLTCAINTSGSFTIYDDGSNIKYRKIGKMVEVVGAIKPKTAISGGTASYVFATLPSGYRPSLAITERCQGSSGHSWLFSITTGGDLRYSRYSNGSGCVDLPADTWLPFHTMFFIN